MLRQKVRRKGCRDAKYFAGIAIIYFENRRAALRLDTGTLETEFTRGKECNEGYFNIICDLIPVSKRLPKLISQVDNKLVIKYLI